MAKETRPLRSRGKKKTKSKSAKSGGLTLNTISLLAYILFCVVIIVIVNVLQFNTQHIINAQQSSLLYSAASKSASRLGVEVATYASGVRAIALDPETRKLIQQDPAAIIKRQQELVKIFPHAMSLRFIRSATVSPSDKVKPHIGFACVDLFNKAKERVNAPPVEVHVFGQPNQHIDVIHPILSADGATVIGYVQLVVNIQVLTDWLKHSVVDEYIELNQQGGSNNKLIAKAGDASLRLGDGVFVRNVPGTTWSLQVWPGEKISSFYNRLYAYGMMSIAVILVAMIVFLLRQSLSRALSEDIEQLLQFAVSKLRGKQDHQYAMKMKEFTVAAQSLDEILSKVPIDRERDDDPNAVSMAGNLQADINLDPMFMSQDAMSVEEIEDSGANTYMPSAATSQQNVQAKSPSVQTPAAATINKAAAKPGPLPPAEIFKAYDIRGIVGITLTAEHATLIGKALGSEAIARGLKKIAFARDGRLSGPELGQALVKGLMDTGIDVIDVGMVPTPLLYFAAAEAAEASGVMLTGSHNPPDYNGFKMVLGGETLSTDTIQALRQRIEKSDFRQGKGNYSTMPVIDKYIQRVSSDVKLKRPLKVVIDCGNGVAGAVAPKLFKSLGCELVELYCDVDGKFPNHHPDPSKPENLQDLIEAVKINKADLGFAFDGDGDRLGVISSDGNVIWPDRLMMLFAADVISRNPGAQIIYDIKCSSNLTKVIWEKGGEPVMWKTGHSLIKAKMKQSGALLAGEMSGHIFFKERWYGFDDGLYSGARLLEILANDVRQPRVVFSTLPDAVNTPELNVQMVEGEHHKFIDKLIDQADFGDANVTMIDGIRVDYADGWGLVRASNTTPVLVLRFEGTSKEAMKRVQDAFRIQIHAVDPTIKLPF